MPQRNIQNANRFSTIYELLSLTAAKTPKGTALEVKRGDFYIGYTYARLIEDTRKLATLITAELGRGAHIMLCGENGYDYVLSYFAITAAGCAAVPMPTSATLETVRDAIRDCDVSAIIYGDDAVQLAGELSNIKKFSFAELHEQIKTIKPERLQAPSPDDVAELAYTYGAEETPRAAILTHKNICFSVSEMAFMLPLDADDKLYSVLPTAYSYERICGTLYPLSRGACVTYGEGLRHLSTNLRRVSPTAMLCVPIILDRIYGKIWANIEKKGIVDKVLRAIKLTEAAGPLRTAVRREVFAEIHDTLGGRLSVLFCGGGVPAHDSVYGLRQFGIRTLASYGTVETAALMCANRRDLHEYSSVGTPVPDGLLDIYNMQPDGIGEVRYKGSNVTSGYYKNAPLTESVLRDGWFYTGDMGYFDRRGFLHIVGKRNNMILRARRRAVFPEELEAKLYENPFVSEAVVVGKLDAAGGDYDIVAIIEPNRDNLRALYGENFTRAQLESEIKNAVSTVNASVEPYKAIVRAVITDGKLEKNEAGKILRSNLPL